MSEDERKSTTMHTLTMDEFLVALSEDDPQLPADTCWEEMVFGYAFEDLMESCAVALRKVSAGSNGVCSITQPFFAAATAHHPLWLPAALSIAPPAGWKSTSFGKTFVAELCCTWVNTGSLETCV